MNYYNKNLHIFLISILILITFSRCTSPSLENTFNKDFVYLKGKSFMIHKKPFYPVVLNYIASIQMDKNGSLYIRPSKAYSLENQNRFRDKQSCLNQFKADMQMIKDLGFNAIRLVGIGEIKVENDENFIHASLGPDSDSSLILNDQNQRYYFEAINQALTLLDEIGLKAIILLKALPEEKSVNNQIKSILNYFKDKTSIMAWDFFNEPLYFDDKERDKKEVYKLVNSWKNIMRKYAPNHLLTIGLTGTREVFEWDPNILAVDFVSIHPYEFQPTEVENEIYWYGKYVNKPWIVGETGLSADNDSIPYEKQTEFAKKTLQWAYDCGASGFSWWQYKDVQWNHFQSDYLGVLSMKGTSLNSKGDSILGTPKPAVKAFQEFHPNQKRKKCNEPATFYNYSSHKQYRIVGKMINEITGKPITEGIFLAWNQYCSKSYHTFTKPDGTFELYGDFKFYHWIASATRYNVIRNDFDWDKSSNIIQNIPTYNLGTIKIKPLHFRNSDY